MRDNANNGILHSALELKDNTVIVVLGASGDLAKKKTVRDALYTLLPTLYAQHPKPVLVTSLTLDISTE